MRPPKAVVSDFVALETVFSGARAPATLIHATSEGVAVPAAAVSRLLSEVSGVCHHFPGAVERGEIPVVVIPARVWPVTQKGEKSWQAVEPRARGQPP